MWDFTDKCFKIVQWAVLVAAIGAVAHQTRNLSLGVIATLLALLVGGDVLAAIWSVYSAYHRRLATGITSTLGLVLAATASTLIINLLPFLFDLFANLRACSPLPK